jgi:hypothetical protein
VLRGTLVAGVLGVLAIPLALMGWVRTPYQTGVSAHVEQPVPFDHRHHVRDDGIDCSYCHWPAERSPSAGIPSSELCMGCHAQILSDSPLLAPVRASVEEGTPIPWLRVTRLPDFVFFDHRAHFAAGVGCETCHGRVDLMPRVRKVVAMSMSWCVDCHREPSAAIRPSSEITTMGYEPGTDGSAAPVQSAAPTDCSTCHR